MTQIAISAICKFRPACFYSAQSASQRATVAVSACLAGEKVRYDGADKRMSAYSLLNAELNFVAICPEQGAGLGVPRPPVQLVESGGRINALGLDDRSLDVTTALQDFAAHSLSQLSSTHRLCGYLWKSRSPSCGFNSTPIHNLAGIEIDRGSGIQAGYFQRSLPHLSYCEETQLLTENAIVVFILRCRLVFDLLYASNASPASLHRHYAFLHEHFDKRIANNLHALSAVDRKPDYLAALLAGCCQMPEKVLLGLFTE